MFALSYSSTFLDRDKADSLLECIEKDSSVSVKTSGSTGLPKEHFFEMRIMKSSARMTNTHFDLSAATNALLCLSLDTIAGKMMCIRAFEGNYKLQIENASSRPLEHCVTPVDFVAMVPVQLKESLEHDLEKLKNIRVILVGGGPISDEIESDLKKQNLTVFHSYGMTETVSHVAIRKVGAQTETNFQAMPRVHFSQIDNQLILSAEHLEITDLKTNDIVELESPQAFKWIGRKDFVVNSGGYKIQLEELEKRIAKSIHFPFFLWKENHDKWGESLLICHAESKNDHIDLSDIDLKVWEKPKKTIQFSNILFSDSGKVLRKATFDQTPISIHG